MAERIIQGNATDSAILRMAAVGDKNWTSTMPRLFQIPFNSSNKWMLTLHGTEKHDETNRTYQVFVKGA